MHIGQCCDRCGEYTRDGFIENVGGNIVFLYCGKCYAKEMALQKTILAVIPLLFIILLVIVITLLGSK